MVDDLPSEFARLVTALRTTVPASATLKDRVLAAVHAEPLPRRASWRGAPLMLAAGAVAVVAATVALALRPARSEAARQVPFVLTAPNAARVSLVGDFNDWNPRATPLHRAAGNVWWVVVALAPGRYHYSFVVDGTRWVTDPVAPRAADDDYGQQNSVVTILAQRS
jgi:predicted carbohydrate-binding protein with CBM48